MIKSHGGHVLKYVGDAVIASFPSGYDRIFAEGENVFLQYGHDKGSPIVILRYCINMTAKISSITESDKIKVGKMCTML